MKTILIVDDDPFYLEIFAEVMARERLPTIVKTATSGDEAKGIMREGQVDLLASDASRPGENVLDLVRWVKANYPTVPIILAKGL